MRILVVEDEARVARQIASALTEAGHDPAVVHDGETALDEVLAGSFQESTASRYCVVCVRSMAQNVS